VNLRGRGGSEAIGPYDPTAAARDVVAIMEELRAGPSVVVGHSLGGLVALLVNDLRPDLVRGIVLGDSPLSAASGGGFAQTVKLIRAAGSMQVIDEPILSRFFVETTPEEVRASVRAMMLDCPADVGAGMLDKGEVFVKRMGEILKQADKKPFMAIWSARPLGNPERVREACPYIRQEPMGECGHFFQMEEPQMTNALLRAFLDDVRNDPRLSPAGP
jgi:pimeloyl-ACP methyl ester carboxylesterase